MLATRLTSALGLDRQNQQPSTGSPVTGAPGPLVSAEAASTVSSRPMSDEPCRRSAASAPAALSNWTKPNPCSLPARRRARLRAQCMRRGSSLAR